MAKTKRSLKVSAAERITGLVQKWFLAEPLLFAAWTTHQLLPNSHLLTIRVGNGQIEFNPQFIDALDDMLLSEVMKLEALRIVLNHPYERRQPSPRLAWEASNLALVECSSTRLPLPSARQRFGSDQFDRKFFEFYYQLLSKDPASPHSPSPALPSSQNSPSREPSALPAAPIPADRSSADSADESTESESEDSSALDTFCDSGQVGNQNAMHWEADSLRCEQMNEIIGDIEASQRWGTLAGRTRELILANRVPRLDYRRVLRAFRATVLATDRRLTRMKPSRRYGFEYMGSRRDFTTALLFAIDVSGSVSSQDIRNAFSIVNRLFKYGIASIDVLWFDTQVQGEVQRLDRARHKIEVQGRGGTNFQPVMDYLDEHRQYDGMLIFTDGYAPPPRPPTRNRRTRIVWLFNSENSWRTQHGALQTRGQLSAYIFPETSGKL